MHVIKLRCTHRAQGRIQWRAIAPPKNYESDFFRHDFVQFTKQHSRYEAILQYVVLPWQYCKVYFISLTVVNP